MSNMYIHLNIHNSWVLKIPLYTASPSILMNTNWHTRVPGYKASGCYVLLA